MSSTGAPAYRTLCAPVFALAYRAQRAPAHLGATNKVHRSHSFMRLDRRERTVGSLSHERRWPGPISPISPSSPQRCEISAEPGLCKAIANTAYQQMHCSPWIRERRLFPMPTGSGNFRSDASTDKSKAQLAACRRKYLPALLLRRTAKFPLE